MAARRVAATASPAAALEQGRTFLFSVLTSTQEQRSYQELREGSHEGEPGSEPPRRFFKHVVALEVHFRAESATLSPPGG